MEIIDESMIGKKVMFLDAESHEESPEWYPPVRTVGKIVSYTNDSVLVQWPSDSGVYKHGNNEKEMSYAWFCCAKDIELVDKLESQGRNSNEMTDEEVWKMLEPKMTKNGFNPVDKPYCRYYDAETVHTMVALAYRCAFARGKKGKPFEYQKKNKEEKNIED